MPVQASCEFVDPKLSNVVQGPKARGQHLTTKGQQIRMMVSGIVLLYHYLKCNKLAVSLWVAFYALNHFNQQTSQLPSGIKY